MHVVVVTSCGCAIQVMPPRRIAGGVRLATPVQGRDEMWIKVSHRLEERYNSRFKFVTMNHGSGQRT